MVQSMVEGFEPWKKKVSSEVLSLSARLAIDSWIMFSVSFRDDRDDALVSRIKFKAPGVWLVWGPLKLFRAALASGKKSTKGWANEGNSLPTASRMSSFSFA